MPRRASALALLAALAGCGSQAAADLPPVPGPPASPPLAATPEGSVVPASADPPAPERVARLGGGRLVAVLLPRARRLELRDTRTHARVASTPVGVGPTHVACLDGGPCYVADTRGAALLVVRTRPLRVVRRVYLPGEPYGLALDPVRRRLWVTLPSRNVVAEMPAHGRPHVLALHPAVRQADAITVDSSTGAVTVIGVATGVLQRLSTPPRTAIRG
jgi:DNA-binding beta-propeller fold protein YncE